jgi:Zn finger protein HypA/HybF involved in hydrogenase expression
MNGTNQFYADNESDTEISVQELDLSLAYEVKPLITPENEWENQPVVFYCHDCERCVDVKKRQGSVKFACELCNGNKIMYGTKSSIDAYFHLNEEGVRKD